MKKKILISIALIIGLMIISMALIGWVVTSSNTDKGDHEVIMASLLQSPKKALIVYQPAVSETTTSVANEIARGLNDGGYEVTINYPGKHLSTDVSEYSIVVFGAPALGGEISKVLTEYMSSIEDFSSSKVVIFATGISDRPVELDFMEDFLQGVKADKKVKFVIRDKEKEQQGYELGRELAGE